MEAFVYINLLQSTLLLHKYDIAISKSEKKKQCKTSMYKIKNNLVQSHKQDVLVCILSFSIKVLLSYQYSYLLKIKRVLIFEMDSRNMRGVRESSVYKFPSHSALIFLVFQWSNKGEEN